MKPEPATVLIIELGAAFFVFLFLPLIVVLGRLQSVWSVDKAVGLLLSGIVILTGIFFFLYFAGLAVISFSGR